ncbi:hypothetical protein [Haloferax sp. Atlit-4N]|nr:hypothetical protein [Haloferax sp. Atlit-4N]
MSERPVSRQPSCRYCDHEEHTYTRCHAELGDPTALCPCPPHRPNGIYT